MSGRRAVALGASALACALGQSPAACAQAMFDGEVSVSRLEVERFSRTMQLPWYAISSALAADSEERFYQLVDSVVAQALSAAALSVEEQRAMPVLLGSSSFEVGVSEARYRAALLSTPQRAWPIQISSIGHLLGHLRRRHDLPGPDFTYGTACAASANALLGGMRMIEQGQAEHALVIGVELQNLTTLAGFVSLELIAEGGVRPFDQQRSGMILGESCAAVVLSAAQSSRASSIILRGGASLCDSSSITSTNTDGLAIAQVIQQALDDAQLQAGDITLIKAHGTASIANDLAEARALHQVFAKLPPVFALKSYIGHTLGACGVSELILAAQAIERRCIPGTPGFQFPDPALGVIPAQGGQQLDADGACLLNYFGFGGNNSVLVLGYNTGGDSLASGGPDQCV